MVWHAPTLSKDGMACPNIYQRWYGMPQHLPKTVWHAPTPSKDGMACRNTF